MIDKVCSVKINCVDCENLLSQVKRHLLCNRTYVSDNKMTKDIPAQPTLNTQRVPIKGPSEFYDSLGLIAIHHTQERGVINQLMNVCARGTHDSTDHEHR